MSELFGASLLPDANDMSRLLIRAVLNLVSTVIVVRLVYFRLYHHRDYIFTYFLLNVVTFCLAFLLSRVSIGLGFAIGLFAVFGILRYRTEAIRVRNLTYLFVVIGLGLVNALANEDVSLVELLFVDVLIVAAVVLLEATPFSGREESHRITYDRLDLLQPGSTAELLKDLRTRTRLPVARYEIGNVDLLRDTVDIAVYYPVTGQQSAINPSDES
jgi:hypothetical protein